ncbi:MAG: exodeoxyribonuclease VII large subunit [Planctomycetota bacterium]
MASGEPIPIPGNQSASRVRSPSGPSRFLTVTQVTTMVKQALESSLPPTLYVVGEISNFKRHTSGHLYFTLKDSWSELACVMWRSAAAFLPFKPEDGLEVIATGGIEVFERAGRYQLYARKLEPKGIGALELAFRQLYQKLSAEGLFDLKRKKPIPRFPERIMIITSPTGAAVADIFHAIHRRFPCVEVLLYPVSVQGKGAAAEIAEAIRNVNHRAGSLGGIDVMIVGRGGGSLEDLWAFNEEGVARAIAASRIPIISAVGHEVDVTIADLVADLRAATPTAAAELAVPVLQDVLASLDLFQARFLRTVNARAEVSTARLAGLLQRGFFRDPAGLILRSEQWLDDVYHRANRGLHCRVHEGRRRLDSIAPSIDRLAPHAILKNARERLRATLDRMHWAMCSRTADQDRRLVRSDERLRILLPNAKTAAATRLDALAEKIPNLLRHRLTLLAEQLRGRHDLLSALGYKSILGRGFSITRRKKDGQIIRSTHQIHALDRIETELLEGRFESDIVALHQQELFE